MMLAIWRFSHRMHQWRIPLVPPGVQIGTSVSMGYKGLGVILHRRAVIGNNVLIGTGAKILGPIRVGRNARIGANAVVITDVPADTTAVGVPARIRLRTAVAPSEAAR